MNELVLYGSVGGSWWDEEYFTAASVRSQLAGMDRQQPLTVRINSGGGIATEGQAIYTALKDYPGPVTVVIDGVAASAASLIAMAGDTIRMRMGAWMLIHDPAQWMVEGRGTEEDHRRLADLLGVVGDAYAEIYAARAGISRDEARAIMRDETVMDGAKAVELGFADERDGAEAVPEAAFDYRIYANAPAALRQASERLGKAPAKAAVMAMFAGGARITRKEPEMADKTQAAPEVKPAPVTTPPAAQAPAPDAAAIAAQATASERERVRRITASAQMAGLPEMAAALIEEGVSFDVAQDRITAAWAAKGGDDKPRFGAPTARILRDERETMRAGMEGALVAQLGRTAPETEAARPYMGHSIVEMAAVALDHRGPLRTPGDRLELLQMAFHSTSDFTSIFENALNKRLLGDYQLAEPVYQRIATRMDFMDFRPHPVSGIGGISELQPVKEGGELKYGSTKDKKETLQLEARGIVLALTRQMLVNDDLGAIEREIRKAGLAVARTEESVFFGMLLSGTSSNGPTMSETGRQLFNTTDGTLAGTAAAITVTSVAAGRAAIQKQKGINGEDLGLTPSILLVGPDKLTEAEQLVATIQPQQASNVNVFSGRLTVISTPKITGNAWYLMTAPSAAGALAYGFLSGDEGPRIRMDEPFGVQGVRYSIERDFGCGAVDIRGVYRNAGA